MQTKLPDLKSCPFCGAKAVYAFIELRELPFIGVRCTHCAAMADAAMLDEYIPLDQVFDVASCNWNMRVSPAADVDNSTDQ